MRQIIETGLPALAQPFSWATRGGGLIFTAHGPVQKEGSILTGSAEEQISLTFDNLMLTLKAAGITPEHVLQIIVYLTDERDVPLLDEIYRRYFSAPYPNRSTVIVHKLVVPGMKIEITATACAES